MPSLPPTDFISVLKHLNAATGYLGLGMPLFAAVITFGLTLDTLRRYFTAKRRWTRGVLITQLVLLPAIAIACLAFVLKVALPMLVGAVGN
jgi:hypothetical protein